MQHVIQLAPDGLGKGVTRSAGQRNLHATMQIQLAPVDLDKGVTDQLAKGIRMQACNSAGYG